MNQKAAGMQFSIRVKGVTMLIPILRNDSNYDYVKDFILDDLIDSKEIVKFKRCSGWVTIGSDSIRTNKRKRTFVSAI
jgi:hypothetical protein